MMTYFDMSQLSRGASAIGRMVQEHEERVAALEHDLIAALARAEAAEAERDAAARRAFSAEAENQRLEAENRRLTARVAELEAERWNRVTDTEPPDGVRVLMQVEAWRRGRIWQHLDDAMLVRGWKPLPPVLRSWPPPTEEGGDGS